MSSRIARSCVALALTLGSASDIEAQQRLFPQVRASSCPRLHSPRWARSPTARQLARVDYRSRSGGLLLGAGCRPVLGAFFDANAATAWRVSSSAKAGISLETGPGGKEIGFGLIGHSGLSTRASSSGRKAAISGSRSGSISRRGS